MKETIFLVKFDRGYCAKKQPRYEGSFTNDVNAAQHYKTLEKAKERGDWGVNLVTNPLNSYTIEKYTVVTSFEFEGVA